MNPLRDQISRAILGKPLGMAIDAILALPAIATALAGRDAVLEEAARVAERYPAATHGSLPAAPHKAAATAAAEVAASIRALAAAPAPSGWRDVETDPPPWFVPRPFATAPANGDTILVYRADAGWFTAHYIEADAHLYSPDLSEDGFFWCSTEGEDLTDDAPTLWMPLPPLPAAPQEAAHDRD